MVLFTILIYCPLAHMTWSVDGLFANFGDILGFSGYEGLHVLDFAGGTVVHMSAGLAAICGAIYLGKRKKVETQPANIPFIILNNIDIEYFQYTQKRITIDFLYLFVRSCPIPFK